VLRSSLRRYPNISAGNERAGAKFIEPESGAAEAGCSAGIDRNRSSLVRGSNLKLIASRIIPFLDGDSLEERSGREALFRAEDGGFVLYLSDGDGFAGADERLIALKPREALIWINESVEAGGSFWQ